MDERSRRDARISQITERPVRDLRYHFPEVEAPLNNGKEIEVHQRKRLIAGLLRIPRKAEA